MNETTEPSYSDRLMQTLDAPEAGSRVVYIVERIVDGEWDDATDIPNLSERWQLSQSEVRHLRMGARFMLHHASQRASLRAALRNPSPDVAKMLREEGWVRDPDWMPELPEDDGTPARN